MRTEIKKTISLGKVDYTGNGRKTNLVELDIRLQSKTAKKGDITTHLKPLSDDYFIFSVSASVWNQSKTDILACGQCLGSIEQFITRPDILRLISYWKEYHLNNLRAGTYRQDKLIDKLPEYDYGKAVTLLKENNLLSDRGYRYGRNWLIKLIPTEVIEDIQDICLHY